MTEAEKIVIQWAFNVTDSIVAGTYDIPKPMVYALNQLQDATYQLLHERNKEIKDCISSEYKEFHDKYWKEVEDKIQGKEFGER